MFPFRDANYYEKPEKISILNMTEFRNMTINFPVVIKYVSMLNPPLPSYIKPGEPQSKPYFSQDGFLILRYRLKYYSQNSTYLASCWYKAPTRNTHLIKTTISRKWIGIAAARLFQTVGTLLTWLRILYMCTSLNCIGWRVKSKSILKRVVVGIAKKFDEFVLI